MYLLYSHASFTSSTLTLTFSLGFTAPFNLLECSLTITKYMQILPDKVGYAHRRLIAPGTEQPKAIISERLMDHGYGEGSMTSH